MGISSFEFEPSMNENERKGGMMRRVYRGVSAILIPLFFIVSGGAALSAPKKARAQAANPQAGTPSQMRVRRITTGTTDSFATLTQPLLTVLWLSPTAGNKTSTIPGCPAGDTGSYLTVVDGAQTAGQYPITIVPTSGTIGPPKATSLQLTNNGQTVGGASEGPWPKRVRVGDDTNSASLLRKLGLHQG